MFGDGFVTAGDEMEVKFTSLTNASKSSKASMKFVDASECSFVVPDLGSLWAEGEAKQATVEVTFNGQQWIRVGEHFSYETA